MYQNSFIRPDQTYTVHNATHPDPAKFFRTPTQGIIKPSRSGGVFTPPRKLV